MRTLVAAIPGGSRSQSEDRCFVDEEVGVFGVFGEEQMEGGVEVAIECLRVVLPALRAARAEKERVEGILKGALEQADKVLRERSRLGKPVAATATVVHAWMGTLSIAHIGDGRLYLGGGNGWRRLTRDHNPTEDGDPIASRSLRPGFERVLTRVLGFESAGPEVTSVSVPPDSLLLLCTDGAWRPIDPTGSGTSLPHTADAVVEAIRDRRLAGGSLECAALIITRVGGQLRADA